MKNMKTPDKLLTEYTRLVLRPIPLTREEFEEARREILYRLEVNWKLYEAGRRALPVLSRHDPLVFNVMNMALAGAETIQPYDPLSQAIDACKKADGFLSRITINDPKHVLEYLNLINQLKAAILIAEEKS